MNLPTSTLDLRSEATDPAAVTPVAYEPPTLRLLGNVHDLLAMAKTFFCDTDANSPGDLPTRDDPACPGDPG